jgi:uncharacterized protein (DUF427 family)
MRGIDQLRYEPTPKRIRAKAGGHTVLDSRRAVNVWEPRRVVPSYAVPEEDIRASLLPASTVEAEQHLVRMGSDGPPVLTPSTPFAAHSSDGEALSLEVDGVVLEGSGFRPADPDLSGYVVLDFAAFDEWLEEDEPIVGHPHDPFSRIDVRRSDSRVQVEVDGVLVADTTSARLLFETGLPPRFYLPREDVRMDLLRPSSTTTTCAYKGHASYWSVEVAGRTHADLAWTYEQPLADASEVAGHVTFFDERVDVTVDGERRARPVTYWS